MIPSYILLALLSMLLVGIADFTYSRAVRKGVTRATMICSQGTIFLPLVTLWAILDGSYAWTPYTFLGPIAGFLIFFATAAFMKSVDLGEASVSTPIYRISFVITALLAIVFLHESMTLQKGLGFLFAAAAIFFLSEFPLNIRGIPKERTSSIVWAVAAMTSLGFLNVVYKIGVTHGVAPTMLLHSQAIFFNIIVFTYAYITQGGPRFSRTGWAHASVTAITLLTGLIALLAAFQEGEASVVTPIGQLSFVVSALMATLWLKEKFTKRKAVGLLLAMATIAAFLPD
jgi:transporter family protein